MEKQMMAIEFDSCEMTILALAVETLSQSLHDKADIETIAPLMRKMHIAAEMDEDGVAVLGLTFSGLSTGGEK